MTTSSPTAESAIFRSGAVVASGIVLGRALGVLREIALARAFGTGGLMDGILLAFTLPDLLSDLLIGGVLSAALVPLFVVAQRRPGDIHAIVSNLMSAVCLITVMLAFAGVWFTSGLVHIIAPGFSSQMAEITSGLIRYSLLALPVTAITTIFASYLNAREHFLVPSMGTAIYNVTIIAGVIASAFTSRPFFVVLAVLVGSLIRLLSQWFMGTQLGLRPQFVWPKWRTPEIREIARLFIPTTFSLSVLQINVLVNRALASYLAAGSISALNFANKLVDLPNGVFSSAIYISIFPFLSAALSDGRGIKLGSVLGQGLRLVAFLTVPAVVLLLMYPTELVEILFMRGSFGQESVILTVSALRYFSFSVVPYGFSLLYLRVFHSLRETRSPVIAGIVSILVNLGLVLLLRPLLKHQAIALSVSIVSGLQVLVLAHYLKQRHSISIEKADVKKLVVIFGLGAVSLVFAKLFRTVAFIPDHGIAAFASGVVAVYGMFFSLCFVLGVDEFRQISTSVVSRLRKFWIF